MLIRRLKPNEAFPLRTGGYIVNKSKFQIEVGIETELESGTYIEESNLQSTQGKTNETSIKK